MLEACQAIGVTAALGEPGEHSLPASTPITGDVLFSIAPTTPEQADHAIAAAAATFTAWRSTPAPVRGALVARLGELLTAHQQDLATLVTVEVGKITAEARGEVQEMIDVCQFSVGLSRQLYGRTIASERAGHRLLETWHPLGVVGVITAFNFPGRGLGVEHRGGTGLRRHGGVETLGADAVDGAGLPGAAQSGRR